MTDYHYIGFDVHKKSIQFCTKQADGQIVAEGRIAATRLGLAEWVARQSHPWKGAMEATMFSAWIYDELASHAAQLKSFGDIHDRDLSRGRRRSPCPGARRALR